MSDAEEREKRIEKIYQEAMTRLKELSELQDKIISDYIKELEQEKIKMLQDKLQKIN